MLVAMESPEYCLEITAADNDIDELGHVSNLVFLRWVLDAARAHSNAVGFDHAAYVGLGAVFVVRKHEIEYLRPVYGGEKIALVTWVEAWRAASSVRNTSIRRIADGVEVARASTLWALVAFDGGRPRRIPEAVRAAFASQPR